MTSLVSVVSPADPAYGGDHRKQPPAAVYDRTTGPSATAVEASQMTQFSMLAVSPVAHQQIAPTLISVGRPPSART
jgi:hypothetical protein